MDVNDLYLILGNMPFGPEDDDCTLNDCGITPEFTIEVKEKSDFESVVETKNPDYYKNQTKLPPSNSKNIINCQNADGSFDQKICEVVGKI